MKHHASCRLGTITKTLTTIALALSLGIGCGTAVEPDSSKGVSSQYSAALKASETAQIDEPGIPPAAQGNPLKGAELFVDPESLAMLRANALRDEHPEQAAVLDRIAKEPMALWMGNWNSNIFRAVEHFVTRATDAGAVPVMVAYNIPHRDCGQHSKGGLKTASAYRRWIRQIRDAISERPAVVVLEPDALGHFQECLSEEQKAERMFLLKDAVMALRSNPATAVYLDAGHARWVPAEEMSERLEMAGIEYAHGFALNVSNYVSSEENRVYGHALSERVGGKPYVIDTSRNGAGPYEQAQTPEESWCNPPGRKIGQSPTTSTEDELCHAYLWLKRPGESDGACGGGPVAGAFWLERALQMASL